MRKIDSQAKSKAKKDSAEPVKILTEVSLGNSPKNTDYHSEKQSLNEIETCPQEIGGPKGLEPTRYGDWDVNGKCSDF